jgi:hypothetical protein
VTPVAAAKKQQEEEQAAAAAAAASTGQLESPRLQTRSSRLLSKLKGGNKGSDFVFDYTVY